MSDPETVDESYVKSAVMFVINAHAATVNMRLYPITSTMVTETFDKANEALQEIFKSFERLSIASIENGLLVNDVRLDDIEQQKAPVKSFVAWMNERELSTVEFEKGITSEELQSFFSILSGMTDAQDRVKLTEDLAEQSIKHASVNQRVYVAVTTDSDGEIIGGAPSASSPLNALKDELLIRYLMGKVNLNDVEDHELVEVLSDPGKVGGLLSRFLGEEGAEGGVLMKSQKASEALNAVAEMVKEIDDDELREAMGDKITNVIAEMSPREMTSILSGCVPEDLNIRHIRENIITMLSNNQLLEMVDFLIEDYDEMKSESGELNAEWTRKRLQDMNELLLGVRGERSEAISEAIDRKLDEAGIAEERDPGTGKRVLSAYQMLGGPLTEDVVELGEGIDQTVPRQIRQLYIMEELDLAAGMLRKLAENFHQDSPSVRRFATALFKETLEGLDNEHRAQAADVLCPSILEEMRKELDFQAFTNEVDSVVRMAGTYMRCGRVQDAVEIIATLTAVGAEDVGKGDELIKHVTEALSELMGAGGVIDVKSLLLEEDEEKRRNTIQALSSLGPDVLIPLVNVVKDRGETELHDRALDTLQSVGEPGIKALVSELEKENPWYAYRNILNVIAERKIEEGLPQVIAMVAHPDERIRREAVRSLAHIGSPDSFPAVMSAANDTSIVVRKTAVRALGVFGNPNVAQYLLNIINGQGPRGKEEEQGVVEAACLSLGDLHDSSYLPQLAALLRNGGLFKKTRPDEVKAAACIALGNIGNSSAMSVLEKAKKDSSQIVRGSAEKAIHRLKSEIDAPEPQ